MLALDFPGSQKLVSAVDSAVCQDCDSKITNELRDSLCRLIRDPAVKLPDCVFERASDHYARRELYRSENLGYSVIAMTWGPGHGTFIHHHCGMLVTGDRTHFGRFYGKKIQGVTVLSSAMLAKIILG